MNVFDFFRDRWRSDAVQLTLESIGAAQISGPTEPPVALRAGERYFRITLAEMFLKNDRDWFTDYAPAIYSIVKLKFGDREEIVSHISGPSGLKDLEAASLNRAVLLNYFLTPLLPFNGGDVELEIGLVALPGSNSAKRLLKVLTDFSKTLAVPQVSIAMGFAQPLLNGIMELVGSGETKLVLRLRNGFGQGGNALTSGFFAVIDIPAGTLDKRRLFVRDDRLHYGDTLQTAVPLRGLNYFLVRIDAPEVRDDYLALASINDPFRKAMDALQAAVQSSDAKKKEKLEEAEGYLTQARFAAYGAKELTTKVGRRQVVDALRAEFDQAKRDFGEGVAGSQSDLAQAMANAQSPSEARRAGEVQLSELLPANDNAYS